MAFGVSRTQSFLFWSWLEVFLDGFSFVCTPKLTAWIGPEWEEGIPQVTLYHTWAISPARIHAFTTGASSVETLHFFHTKVCPNPSRSFLRKGDSKQNFHRKKASFSLQMWYREFRYMFTDYSSGGTSVDFLFTMISQKANSINFSFATARLVLFHNLSALWSDSFPCFRGAYGAAASS